MQPVKLSLACLICLSMVGSATAQTVLESDSGIATLQDYSGGVSYGGAYFDVRTMTGDGVGYRNGYTQLGVTVPRWLSEDMYIAPNARLLVTDNSEVGANLGVLARRYKSDWDRIFGVYGYYDFDHSVEGFDYNQFAFGFDTLGNSWDARANVYVPTTDDHNFVGEVSVGNTPVFFGNSLGFVGQGVFQQSVAGADFEYGIPLTKRTPWLRGYAGAYFYESAGDRDVIGPRVRAEAWIADDLMIGVNATDDDASGTNVNAVVDFRFSGWKPTRWWPQWTTRERMTMPVQRNWRVATPNSLEDVLIAGKNPETGEPYFIVHVDASNFGPGNGTAENPFSSLPAAAPQADIILVQSDGTSNANPLSGSISLFNNQRLLGEGKAHLADISVCFESIMFDTTITLPGIDTTGDFPFLTSPGDIVTIASNNEVSAFNLVRAGGDAITNSPIPGFSNNFNLNCLNITGNNGGIILANATGTGIIRDVNALNNTIGGISIDGGPAPLNLTVTDVTSNSLPAGTQAFGLELIADTSSINATITNVEFHRNTDGLLLTGTGGDITARVETAAINDNTNDGVRITGAGSDIDLVLIDVNANRNVGEGIQATMTDGSLRLIGRNVSASNNNADNVNLALTDTLMQIDFANSRFVSSSTGSGFVLSSTGGSGGGTLLLENVTASGNVDDGFNLTGDDFTQIDAQIRGSIFNNNLRDAFSVSATNSADVALDIRNTSATGSGRHGLNFVANTSAALDINLLTTTLNDSGSVDPTGSGINGLADNAAVNLTGLAVTAENAGNHGMSLTAQNGANVSVGFGASSFDNAGVLAIGASGVDLNAMSAAQLLVSMTGTTANQVSPLTNDDFGMTVTADGAGTILNAAVNSGGFNNAGVNAVNAAVTAGASSTILLNATDGNNAGADGFLASSDASTLSIQLTDSDFNSAGQLGVTGAGFRGIATNVGTLNLCTDTSTFNGNLEEGVFLSAATTSVVRAHLEGGSANLNGEEGLEISAATGSTVDFRAVDFTFNGNGTAGVFDGVLVNADNATVHAGFFGSLTNGAQTTSADGNTGNGFNFIAANGAYLTARLDTISASNNDGFGIRFDATGAGTDGALILEGDNTIAGNGMGPLFINFNGGDDAFVNITGTFNNNPAGSGVEIDIANVDQALVSIVGNGTSDTIDGNAVHGVDVRITNANQAGVVVSGYTSISNNTIDGVNIVLQNIANAAAVDVLGAGSFNGNGDDAVDVTFINSTMAMFDTSLLPADFTVIDRTTSVVGTLNDCLPLPVVIPVTDVVTAPTSNGILVQNLTIRQTPGGMALPTSNAIEISLNGVLGAGDVEVRDNIISDSLGNGIFTAVTNNSQVGTAMYVNNTITGNLFGDGVRYEQTGGSVDMIVAMSNTAVGNAGYGINVDLNAVAGNTVPAPAVVIDSNDIRDNTGRMLAGSGIFVNAVDTPLALVQISNSEFVSGNFADGIRVFGDNSPITTLNITDNNNISSNTMNGINVGLINGSDVTNLIINNNVVNNVPPPSLGQYNIEVDTSGLTPQQAAFFDAAAQRWEQIIIGELPDVGLIDDLFISATITPIDGVGGILGQAGPTGLRGGNFLPFQGVMFFDSADVAALISAGQFDEVILHEMAHVIGFGTIWDLQGLLLNPGTADPRFTGPLATAEYNTRFGAADPDVPVENIGGPGTADAHWRETIFMNELMTGFLDSGVPNPISRVTIAQWADLGYTVDILQADPFLVTPSSGAIDGVVTRPTYTIGPDSGAIVGSLNGSVLPAIASNTMNGVNITLMNSDATSTMVTNNQILANGLNGLLLTTTGSTLGDVLIDGNQIEGNTGGDGVQLNLSNGMVTGAVQISGNGINLNSGNGVNFELDNMPINSVVIQDNSGGTPGVQLGAVVLFGSFGNDQGIQNTSGAGIDITAVTIDLTAPDFFYDTVEPGAAFPFDPDAAFGPFGAGTIGDVASAGLVSINGTMIDPGVVPISVGGVPVPGGGIPDDVQVVDFTFNDFNPGEIFDYTVDMDTESQTAGGISGIDVAVDPGGDPTYTGPGTATVTFSTGDVVTGAFMVDPGNPFGARFEVTPSAAVSGGISNNGGDGIRINQTNGSDIGTLLIDNNTVDANGLHGVELLVVNSGLGPVSVSNNAITNHANGDGFRIVNPTDTDGEIMVDFGVVGDTTMGNTITGNGGSGVNIAVAVVGDNITSNFTGNTIDGNGVGGTAAGVNLAVAMNGNITGDFDTNSISGNTGEGVNYQPGVNSVITADYTNNTINGNGSHGINIPLQDGGQFLSANFHGNTIGTMASPNGGMGVRLIVPNNAMFNWALGDSTMGQNLISGNVDAGVGIDMTGNAMGVFGPNNAVVNTIFSNTTNGLDPNFNGEGLSIRLSGTAMIDGATFGDAATANTEFNANAGNGFGVFLNGASQFTNATIVNTTADSNTGDGVDINRQGSGVIGQNFLFDNNTFIGNANGLEITAQFALLVDGYTITNNTITDNNNNGIQFNARADGQISTVLTNNTVESNLDDGVFITTTTVAGDAAIVTSGLGAWTGNSFSFNGTGGADAGIDISGTHSLVIGVNDGNPITFSNLINGNTGDGVEVNASGFLTIVDADISGNVTEGTADGRAGVDINSTGFNAVLISTSRINGNLGDGVEIDNTNTNGSSYTLFNNLITFNGRDGVEYIDTGDGTLNINGTNTLTSMITDNGTTGTGGRGVDLIIGGNSSTNSTVNINNTSILRNQLEGVYTILTSSDNQRNAANRDNVASVALLSDGAIGTTPFLTFNMGNVGGNIVNNNGQALNNIGGSGLVMRVGTTRGNDSFNVAGGFASTGNGGVTANVQNNQLFGNFGADVFIQSFVSQVTPATTGGTWTDQNENPRNAANDVFNPTGYQSDPLARLDLVFSNNSGEELAGTNVGASFNNTEAIFKSRTQNQDNATDGGLDDDGPFSTGTRVRNAQRLAARNVDVGGTQLPPLLTIGASDTFLFPGLGQSTFRVNNQAGAGNVFGLGNGFITDGTPFVSTVIDANGVGAQGGGPEGIDAVPFGWTIFP